jgi:hypothetical protein
MKKRLAILMVTVLILAMSGISVLAAPAAQTSTPQANTPDAATQQATPAPSGATIPAANGQNQAGGSSAFTLRANRGFGYQVVDLQGNTVGQVEDMIVQLNPAGMANATGADAARDGSISYLVVSLANSSKRVAVPTAAVRIDPEARRFAVDVNQADLQNVPGFDSSNLPAANDTTWDSAIRSFWSDQGTTVADFGQANFAITARNLLRYRVMGDNNQDYGPVQGRPALLGPPPGGADMRGMRMDASREQRSHNRFFDELVRAYQEYLKIPTFIIAFFIVLGVLLPLLEEMGIPAVDHLRNHLSNVVFGDASSTRDILVASASTLITITSLTFTVLLLAVQQAANTMTSHILDQFLRRPINGVIFGYFIGVSITASSRS